MGKGLGRGLTAGRGEEPSRRRGTGGPKSGISEEVADRGDAAGPGHEQEWGAGRVREGASSPSCCARGEGRGTGPG